MPADERVKSEEMPNFGSDRSGVSKWNRKLDVPKAANAKPHARKIQSIARSTNKDRDDS